MTTGEFADLVQNMRIAQKDYFRTRSQTSLEKSKELEKKVDSLLSERKARIEKEPNPGLFDIY